MRKLAVITLVVLLLPGVAGGQIFRRRPRVGTTPRPAPLPPELPGIAANRRQYRSSRLSLEGYLLTGTVHTDRYISDTLASTSGMFGGGTRLDWRFSSLLSATGDFTAATGGPFTMETVEIGGRFHPARADRVIQPYVDLRGTWAYTAQGAVQPVDGSVAISPFNPFNNNPYTVGRGITRGFGALAGAGMSYSLSRALALTAGVAATRNRMGTVFVAGQQLGSNMAYHVTTTRLIFGLKYTPQRLIPTDLPGAIKAIK